MSDKVTYESGECVHCGSSDIEYETEYTSGDYLVYPYKCTDCGKTGRETYTIEFLENTGD